MVAMELSEGMREKRLPFKWTLAVRPKLSDDVTLSTLGWPTAFPGTDTVSQDLQSPRLASQIVCLSAYPRTAHQ